MKPEAVALGRLARLLRVHRNTITAWIEQGLPVLERGPRATTVDLAEAIAWVRRRDQEAAEERQAAASPDLERERVRKMRTDADLAELELAKRRGALVDRAEAERAWSNYVLHCRARLLSLPAHARVQGVAPEAVSTFERLVKAALLALADERDENEQAATGAAEEERCR